MKYFLIFFMLTDDGAAYAAGSVTHQSRQACIEALQGVTAAQPAEDKAVYFCSRTPLSKWGK